VTEARDKAGRRRANQGKIGGEESFVHATIETARGRSIAATMRNLSIREQRFRDDFEKAVELCKQKTRK